MLKVKDAVSELRASMAYIRSFSDAEIVAAGDLSVNFKQIH